MQKGPTERVYQTDLERCLYCAYFQALGCGGGTRFCVLKNVFLMHDPVCKEECSCRREVDEQV